VESPPKKNNRTVLLLEEHQDCRSATESLLSVSEYTCLGLESIHDIVQTISQHPQALILADYRIGDLNGEELLRRLRQDSLSNPVILMSSLNDDSLQEKCLKAGAAYFLRKPYVPTELLNVLARLFGDQPTVTTPES
jgi:CheY-like chemotaxis protein